ncbi:MAG: sulfate transporter CysZ [Methylococcales bacterium]|nr:sulfate transporter CysZ [Methylococcales bacterium]
MNQLTQQPMSVFSSLYTGLTWLNRQELRQFVWAPVLINFFLYGTVLVLGGHYVDVAITHFIPNWLGWLEFILWPLYFVLFFMLGFFTFGLLANLIASPFYGLLSLKVRRLLRPDAQMLDEPGVGQMFLAELTKLVYFLTRAVPIVIISFIPVVNIIAPLLWALFGAWSLAVEYAAYPLENRGWLFARQREHLTARRLPALSFGALVLAGMTLPLANILVAPVAVIAATLWLESESDAT